MLRNLMGSVSRKSIILLAGTSLLAACGGGGDDEADGFYTISASQGGSGMFGSYFMDSITQDWRDAAANIRDNVTRYRYQSGNIPGLGNAFSNPLFSSRVDYAHAVGLTGAGQVIAIVDTGFRRSHEVFAGKNNTTTGNPGVDDHGTMVASIAAGNSTTMVGVAPAADLIFSDWSAADLTAAANAARSRGAVAQNNSWGFEDALISQTSYDLVFGNTAGTQWLSALRNYALGSGTWGGGVVVFAVDNSNNGSAGLMEGLPVLEPSLEKAWIAVGNAVPNFDDNGVNSVAGLISSPCYEAARWCIMADGYWTAATDTSNTAYGSGTGSSFAAPQVSGALALLAEAFPNLTPHQLRARLLASADNTFSGFAQAGTIDLLEGVGVYNHAYSTIYGHGFLDIRAALLPIGTPSMMSASGEQIDTRSAWMGTGSAMGDAVQKSLASVDVAVTDSLGAGFDLGADKLFAAASPAPLSLKALPRSIGTDLTALRTLPMSTLTDVFAGQDGRTLDFTDPTGEVSATLLVPDAGSDNLGLSVTRSIEDGGFRLDLGLKVARDDGTFIGFGDLGNGGAGTGLAALRVALSQEFASGGFFSLSGEVGRADLDTPSGFANVSDAGFNALGLELGQRDLFSGGDRLSLSVSLPMAVTSGTATLSLPSFGDGMTRSVSFEDVAVDLSPNARQIDYALTYQVPLGDGRELMLKAMHSENYGNIEGNADQALVAAFKWSF